MPLGPRNRNPRDIILPSEQYADLATLLNAQSSQRKGNFYRVLDASNFSSITSGSAIVLYLGTTNGDESDYNVVGGSASQSTLEYQTEITADITLSGSRKGEWKLYPVNSSSAVEITIPSGDVYSENDIINFERSGQGTVEFITDGTSKIRGVRDIDNRYFINDVGSMISLVCKGSDEFVLVGNLTRGYTGPVETSSYSGTLREGETGTEITVYGTGFSANMRVSVSANATLNSWTLVSSTEITLNLDAVGSETDTITVTYYNGDDTTDTDAITIAAESVVVYQDSLDNESIDSSIWDTTTATNGVITETDTRLELTASAATDPNWYGLILKNAVGSSNDLIIVQAKVDWDDSPLLSPRFGLTPSTYDANELAVFQRESSSPYDNYRCIIIDGGSTEVNPDTGVAVDKDVRIKYVPSTGAITFEYWNGSSWAEFSASSGNVDLGSSVKAILYNKMAGSPTTQTVGISDFYISDNDYTTQYPT